jgi:DNA-binding LacI/PurR family transcriptional regulator
MKNIGLVLVQSARRVAHEPLLSGLAHGLEEVLVKSDMRLVTRVVRDAKAEKAVYRHWGSSASVDAVVLVGMRPDDPRRGVLDELRVPFAAVVDEGQVGDFSAVVVDNAGTMRSVVEHLVSRGHEDIVYLSAEEPSSTRQTSFLAETSGRGIAGRVLRAELTPEGAARTTVELLGFEPRPTAVIYDDDVTAIAGLEVLTGRGLAVPDDIAVLAWNDSVLCQSATPPVTAVSNEANAIGRLVARCVIEMGVAETPTRLRSSPPFIVERAST